MAALPRDLAFVGLAALCFVAVAGGLALAVGAPFNLPTERMSVAIGVHYIVPFVIAIAGYSVIQAAFVWLRRDSLDRARLRANIAADVYFMALFVVVVYVHFHVKMWMPLINPALFDAAYFAADNALRGVVDGAIALRRAVAPVVPNVDIWYQVGYLSLYAFSLWFHAIGDRRYHYHNLVALLLLAMVGALSYLVAPAVGPFIYETGANELATGAQGRMYAAFLQVQADGAGWLERHGGAYFTGPPAAMPSLHIAAAWIITYYAVKARLLIAPWVVLMLVWIAVESIAARWHYLVDHPPGLLLAVAIIMVTNRVCAARAAGVAAPDAAAAGRPATPQRG